MGLLKLGIGAAVVVVATFYGGYKVGRLEYDRMPYQIEPEGAGYMLRDKRSGARQPLSDNFQLGTIDHRVEGLLKEMQTNLSDVNKCFVTNFPKYFQPR